MKNNNKINIKGDKMNYFKFTAIASLIVLFFSGGAFTSMQAQETDPEFRITPMDTSDMEDGLDLIKNFSIEKMNRYIFDNSKPTIEANWGGVQSRINRDFFKKDLKDIGILDFRLGYSKYRQNLTQQGIIHYSSHSIFYSDISDQWKNNKTDAKSMNYNISRFGFSSSEGLGYRLADNKTDLVLYNTSSLVWSDVDFSNSSASGINDTLLSKDDKRMKRIEGQYRFGESFEAGMKLNICGLVGLNAGYEKMLVYPRHLFWQWIGSQLVESIANGLLDDFIRDIATSAPKIAPVAKFVLQNGLAYGVYKLREKKMNWPFGDEAPMSVEMFKVGLSFSF